MLAAYVCFEISSDSKKLPPELDKLLNDPDALVSSLGPGVLHPNPQQAIDDADKPVSSPSPAAIPKNSDTSSSSISQTASVTQPSSPPISASVSPVPAAAPVTAVNPPISAPASNPLPDAAKPWAPPDVMPARPNWTWTTSDGKTYQNVVVTKIEPTTVTISHSLGVAHIPISSLPAGIQTKLNYDPAAALQIATLIEDKLVSSDGSAFSSHVPSIQYYIFYYSARWCPSCHAYTPELVKWYSQFQPAHPNFELIFVSEDTSEAEMLAYMKEMAVPWPAMRYDQLAHSSDFQGPGVERYAGNGIPYLALVDASGKLLAKSYEDKNMVDPTPVMDEIATLTKNKPTDGQVTKNPPAPPLVVPAIADAATAPQPETKPWAPSAVMPSQPNWTWNTLDGNAYENVVVTKIEPDTVTITHSLGVAHIPMNLLPRDIQKQLNYDPHAAPQSPQ